MRIPKSIIQLVCMVVIPAIACTNAYSLPQGASVTEGSAQFEYNDKTLTVNASDNAIINYASFDIADGESVIINLPSSQAQILNRVIGANASSLFGNLSCNGLFILINPHGIYIGPQANLDLAKAVISTRDMTDQDFLDHNYAFKKLDNQQVEALLKVDGTINIREAGFGVLIAGGIENNGKIIAPLGKVVLAGCDAVKLNMSSDGLISVAIEEKTASKILDSNGNPITDQIKNTGTIEANAGVVILDAQALPDVFSKAINTSGVIKASAISGVNGKVVLRSNGDILSSGTLIADYLEEKGASFNIGGTYNVGYATIDNLDNAVNLNTGNYIGLIADTVDIIINAGAIITLIGNATFQADLDLNNTGAFTMNAGSSIVGGGFDLTLYTSQNSSLESISGVGTLSLRKSAAASTPTYTSNPATSFSVSTVKTYYGAKFSRTVGTGIAIDPYMIYSVSDAPGGLQYINTWGVDKYYTLANNIDASETSSWNAGGGFIPLAADDPNRYSATFEGNNYSISNLYIHEADDIDKQALFKFIGATGVVQNLTLSNITVYGRDYTGTLASFNYGLVDNVHASGNITGEAFGGSHAGLVVANYGTISDSSSSVNVNSNGNHNAGLVGNNLGGSILRSFATGTISGWGGNGGLVNANNGGLIEDCYATGNVTSNDWYAGGLAAANDSGGIIRNSYSTGNVSGATIAGGLVGRSYVGSTIENSYSTGTVTGGTIGGFIGQNDGASTYTNNWWWKNAGHNPALNDTAGGNLADTQIATSTNQTDFYGTVHPVYWTNGTVGGSEAWDTSADWQLFLDSSPRLKNEGLTPYSFSGSVTGINNGVYLALAIDAGTPYTALVTAGNFSFAFLNPIAANSKLLFYADNAGVDKANLVTVANGLSLAGLSLVDGRIILRNDNAGAMTNDILYAAKGALSDTDIHYSVSGPAGGTANFNDGIETWINAGATYAPGGNINLSGSFTNQGAFTCGTYTTTFNGSNQTITANGLHFYDLTFWKTSGANSTVTINDNFTVDHDLRLENDVGGSIRMKVQGPDAVTNPAITVNGNVDFSPTGTVWVGAAANSLTLNIKGDLTMAGNAFSPMMRANINFTGTGDQTITSNSDLSIVDGLWTVDKSSGTLRQLSDLDLESIAGIDLHQGTLNSNGYNTYISGNWANTGGSFDGTSGGTVYFRNSSITSTISGNSTFGNLACTTANKHLAFSAGSTQTVTNSLTITGNAVNPVYLESTIGGNLTNLNVSGTHNVSYANITDSNAIAPLTATYSNGSNTFGWTIYSENIPEPEVLPSSIVEKITLQTDTASTQTPISVFTPESVQTITISSTGLINGVGLELKPPVNAPESWNPVPETKETHIASQPEKIITAGFDLKNLPEVAQENNKFSRKGYLPAKYRTTVVVFEGKVLSAPYNESGIIQEESVFLTKDQNASVENSLN